MNQLMLAVAMGLGFTLICADSAHATDRTRCWFGNKGSCEATITEDLTQQDSEEVTISVECDGFRFRDEHAVQFDRGNDEINIGVGRHEALVVINIDNEAAAATSEGKEADLTVSFDNDTWGEGAFRLDGRCRTGD